MIKSILMDNCMCNSLSPGTGQNTCNTFDQDVEIDLFFKKITI